MSLLSQYGKSYVMLHLGVNHFDCSIYTSEKLISNDILKEDYFQKIRTLREANRQLAYTQDIGSGKYTAYYQEVNFMMGDYVNRNQNVATVEYLKTISVIPERISINLSKDIDKYIIFPNTHITTIELYTPGNPKVTIIGKEKCEGQYIAGFIYEPKTNKLTKDVGDICSVHGAKC